MDTRQVQITNILNKYFIKDIVFTLSKYLIPNINIVFGVDHAFILIDDTVLCCGSNRFGQLGVGDNKDINRFTKVDTKMGTHDVKKIICGGYYTFAIKNDNTVWGVGSNANAQLGLGIKYHNRQINRFTKVDINNVKKIICGGYYTFILKNDNTIWSVGDNNSGQLGLGDNTDRNSFTKVGINDVKKIICGGYYTFIIKNDNTLLCAGCNDNGQLGLGDNKDREILTKGDTKCGTKWDTHNVKKIRCGTYHTYIIKNDNTVWCVGHNKFGQLGLGDYNNRYTFTMYI